MMKSMWKLVSSSFSNSTGVSLNPASDLGSGMSAAIFSSSVSSPKFPDASLLGSCKQSDHELWGEEYQYLSLTGSLSSAWILTPGSGVKSGTIIDSNAATYAARSLSRTLML